MSFVSYQRHYVKIFAECEKAPTPFRMGWVLCSMKTCVLYNTTFGKIKGKSIRQIQVCLTEIFRKNVPVLVRNLITADRIRFWRTVLICCALRDIYSDYPLSIDFSHISFVVCCNGAILISKMQFFYRLTAGFSSQLNNIAASSVKLLEYQAACEYQKIRSAAIAALLI